MHEDCVYVIGENKIQEIAHIFHSRWGIDAIPYIIADENTYKVAGRLVSDLFQGKAKLFVFPSGKPVYADYGNVLLIRNLLLQHDSAIGIAVGSGTINDLVKLASFEVEREYMLLPTAPSVDGYTAVGSALTVDGFKKTIYCLPPAVLVADVTILKEAPSLMIAAGYADLAAKITAGADWILADTLGIEPINKEVWDMVQVELRENISQPESLARRDHVAIERLFDGLAQTGFAIKKYIDSRPASGAEHLMSHVWEMDHLEMDGVPVSHGFKVGIGTLATTAIYEELLLLSTKDIEKLYSEHPAESWQKRVHYLDTLLTPDLTKDTIMNVSQSKFLEGSLFSTRRELILSNWDTIQERIGEQIIRYEELQGMFSLSGCPLEPGTIGLSKEALEKGIRKAQLIRNRYTCLDLLYEIGYLDTIIETIVGTSKYFGSYLEG